MKKYIFLPMLLALTLAAGGCGPTMLTKKDAFPKMYDEKPLSVLVLPPVNHSTAAEAADYYMATVSEPLTQHGYYVFPLEVVSKVLANEGVATAEQLTQVPMSKYKEFFGADAVLFVTINKWNTSYMVIAGNITVGLSFRMVSTRTGETLWQYTDTIVQDTSGQNSGGGLAGLIVNVVATAIKTASADYVPLARTANAISMSTMPCGKYHGGFGQDAGLMVVNQAKIGQ